MSDEGEEQKPNVGGAPEHLNLQVKSQVTVRNSHEQLAMPACAVKSFLYSSFVCLSHATDSEPGLQDGNVVHFKAKITTPFRKLMTAYCDRQSVASESVVFLFEGERLRGEQTPQEVRLMLYTLYCLVCNSVELCYQQSMCLMQVGMEDGDSIDVVIHQVGGRQA